VVVLATALLLAALVLAVLLLPCGGGAGGDLHALSCSAASSLGDGLPWSSTGAGEAALPGGAGAASAVYYGPGWGGVFRDPWLPCRPDPTAGWHEAASSVRPGSAWPPHPLDGGLPRFQGGNK
jgi:hypothetical protein